MKPTLLQAALAAALLAMPMLTHPAAAHDETAIRADSHAPIGVMGDHMHERGEFMISYRYGFMDMSGARNGTTSLTPREVTAFPNRFFGQPMQPPGLRVVPTEMSMQMHMLGAMYAPTDWVTLMAMGTYVDKSMDHLTFNPMATEIIGGFTTGSSGVGDTKLAALLRVFDTEDHHMHVNLGLSLPTGSITERDRVLTPLGTTPTLRLPYAMQLGSGTVDLMPGVTYTGRSGRFGWGGQMLSDIRLGENSEGYSLGNGVTATVWGSYSPADWVSVSGRVTGTHLQPIDGIDPMIVAPVQTADPDNYGGETVALSLGINLVGQSGLLRGHRFAIEGSIPVYQRLNGPQMEQDFRIMAGYQYAF